MNIKQLNQIAGVPWLEGPSPYVPGDYLIYADESDVTCVDLDHIIRAEHPSDELEIVELKDGEEISHTLDQHQLRGAIVITIK
jgi:hypothetical protein